MTKRRVRKESGSQGQVVPCRTGQSCNTWKLPITIHNNYCEKYMLKPLIISYILEMSVA